MSPAGCPGPFRYVLTVDSDTRLPRGTARRLVGKIAHPLNRPRYDERGRQVRGYGILQPRVTPSLPTRDRGSVFQRLFSTQQGRDPYAFAVSDVYQDVFASGSFSGKGIYDIESVTRALAGRIPENALLSHDLLEGNYARVGPGDRRGSGRGPPGVVRRGGAARPPLDPRRLAAAAVAPAP